MQARVRKQRFRLLQSDGRGNKCGAHYVGGKRYVPGDVIESSYDLTKVFRNKFEQVDEHTPLSDGEQEFADVRPTNQRAVVPVDTAEAEGLTAPTASANTLQDQPVHEVPDELQADSEQHDTQDAKPKPAKRQRHGVDVTDDFSNAELAGIRIFYNKTKKGYIITDAASQQVVKRVKKESSVEAFIAQQLGTQ